MVRRLASRRWILLIASIWDSFMFFMVRFTFARSLAVLTDASVAFWLGFWVANRDSLIEWFQHGGVVHWGGEELYLKMARNLKLTIKLRD